MSNRLTAFELQSLVIAENTFQEDSAGQSWQGKQLAWLQGASRALAKVAAWTRSPKLTAGEYRTLLEALALYEVDQEDHLTDAQHERLVMKLETIQDKIREALQ